MPGVLDEKGALLQPSVLPCPEDRKGVDAVDARSTDQREPRTLLTRWKSFWSLPGKPARFLGWPATLFILSQMLVGIPLLPYALSRWHNDNPLRFACFLGVAVGASLFKVRLPGIQATMSANFLFILVGI